MDTITLIFVLLGAASASYLFIRLLDKLEGRR